MAAVSRYSGEFLNSFFLLISIQWGIIRVEFGELSLPSLLALRDCVDYQGDICETCENLNYIANILGQPQGRTRRERELEILRNEIVKLNL